MKQQLQDKINQFRRLSENIKTIPEVVDRVVAENSDVIISLNKDQILSGRDADGNKLAPNYLQDPYFKSQEAAQSYARYKYSLEDMHNSLIWNTTPLFPTKDRNTPNLIVTGLFQDHLFITTGKGSYTIGSTYIDADDINRKYKGRVYGLAPVSGRFFYTEYVRQAIIKHLHNGVRMH